MNTIRFMIAATAILAACATAGAQPADLVTAHGRTFARAGETFRFVGVNIRAISHYGTATMPYTGAGDITANLDGVQAMGGKVVRLFAANRDFTNAENAAPRAPMTIKSEPDVSEIVSLPSPLGRNT